MEFWNSLIGEEAQEVYAYSLKIQDELKPPRKWYEIQHRNDKQQWIEAYQKEVNSLEKVGGKIVVPYPKDEEVLELLEIFSWKENTFSGKREAKVRMAGRGDKARIKLSLYSPVGGATGMRLLIHTATTLFNQNLRASDIKTAFLNARTNKARYFHLPDGHVKKQGKQLVWKTFCALYGLTDSSFHWYVCLVTYLKQIGLKACSSEECLFIKQNQGGELTLMVLIYVDDLLFTGNSKMLDWFCLQLEQRFKLRKTLEVGSFIGVQVEKLGKGFKLFQNKFIEEAVAKFELKEAKKG